MKRSSRFFPAYLHRRTTQDSRDLKDLWKELNEGQPMDQEYLGQNWEEPFKEL